MTWDDVVQMALALPGAVRGTSYGRDAVLVRGKMFVVIGKEPDHVVLRAGLDAVEMLIATDPACFHQTPHYVGWPAVLARLDAADPDRIALLLEQAWAGHASAAQRKARGV
ncbi:MAG: MmcQ/YjbR family DNA-binding protein [Alphaproteobacteria bacterium]|nr:MmcQ/YjbR family DNA-binding protein [Alphaproteobacteria bacterium]